MRTIRSGHCARQSLRATNFAAWATICGREVARGSKSASALTPAKSSCARCRPEAEYAPVGHAINLASRMQSVAPPGGVVVSEETRRLVEGYFELHAMGPTEVRGIGAAIEVYEVVGVGALNGHFDLAARRGLTRFVGRESELAQMRHALELEQLMRERGKPKIIVS